MASSPRPPSQKYPAAKHRAAAVDLLGEASADGMTEVTVRGSCMEPWIVDGDRITIAPLDPPAGVGDVVLARGPHDELFCHRVLGFDGGSLVLAGDRTLRLDRHPPETILGRVVAVRRGARTRRVERAGLRERIQARLHLQVHRRRGAPWVRLLEWPRRLLIELRALTWRRPG